MRQARCVLYLYGECFACNAKQARTPSRFARGCKDRDARLYSRCAAFAIFAVSRQARCVLCLYGECFARPYRRCAVFVSASSNAGGRLADHA